jgi:alcohol dehydrogenase class IV
VSEFGSISEGEYMAAVEQMAEGALADGCTATNPRVPTKQEVMDIYRAIW